MEWILPEIIIHHILLGVFLVPFCQTDFQFAIWTLQHVLDSNTGRAPNFSQTGLLFENPAESG